MTRTEAIRAAWGVMEPWAAEKNAKAHQFTADAVARGDEDVTLKALRRIAELVVTADDAWILEPVAGELDALVLRVVVPPGPLEGLTLAKDVTWRAWIAARAGAWQHINEVVAWAQALPGVVVAVRPEEASSGKGTGAASPGSSAGRSQVHATPRPARVAPETRGLGHGGTAGPGPMRQGTFFSG